jgi:hypothetical protein
MATGVPHVGTVRDLDQEAIEGYEFTLTAPAGEQAPASVTSGV